MLLAKNNKDGSLHIFADYRIKYKDVWEEFTLLKKIKLPHTVKVMQSSIDGLIQTQKERIRERQLEIEWREAIIKLLEKIKKEAEK